MLVYFLNQFNYLKKYTHPLPMKTAFEFILYYKGYLHKTNTILTYQFPICIRQKSQICKCSVLVRWFTYVNYTCHSYCFNLLNSTLTHPLQISPVQLNGLKKAMDATVPYNLDFKMFFSTYVIKIINKH